MADRITIARPVVNLKAARRHRKALVVAEQTSIQAENADISLLEEYETKLLNVTKTCNWRSSLYIIPCSLGLFVAVHSVKRLRLLYFSVSRFPHPSLIVTAICSSIAISLLLFPIFTLASLVSIGIVLRYRELVPVVARSVSCSTNVKLSHLEAHLRTHGESLRSSFEQHTGHLINKLERQQQQEGNPLNCKPSSPSSPNAEHDPELGQLLTQIPIDCREPFPINIFPHQQHDPYPAWPTTTPPQGQGQGQLPIPNDTSISREQKLTVLRELRGRDLDVELNRLRLIPQFDAEGWLLVNNPDIDRFNSNLKPNVRLSEETEKLRRDVGGGDGASVPTEAKRKRLSL